MVDFKRFLNPKTLVEYDGPQLITVDIEPNPAYMLGIGVAIPCDATIEYLVLVCIVPDELIGDFKSGIFDLRLFFNKFEEGHHFILDLVTMSHRPATADDLCEKNLPSPGLFWKDLQ